MMVKKCDNCRYWSEMIAESIGCGPIKALCLSDESPHKGKMTTSNQTCDAWGEATMGTVDDFEIMPNY